jgi:hypothetical protein
MKNRGKLKRMDVRKIVPKTAVKGAVPGTISYVGKPRNEQIKFDIVEYDESGITEHTADTLSKLTDVIASPDQKMDKSHGGSRCRFIERYWQLLFYQPSRSRRYSQHDPTPPNRGT